MMAISSCWDSCPKIKCWYIYNNTKKKKKKKTPFTFVFFVIFQLQIIAKTRINQFFSCL